MRLPVTATVSIKDRWQNLPQSVRFGTIIFMGSRIFYSVWAIIILTIQPASAEAPQPIIGNLFEKWLLAPWYRWDAEWFLKIAGEGYSVIDGRSAYYPLYPFLTRLAGDLLGGNYLLSGLIVSNLATWMALILLYKITRRHFNDQIARNTVIALALYPFYIFNLIYYADSLLLLFSLATIEALESKRWKWVGLFAGLAVLSKLPGLILLAPISWEFFAQRRRVLSSDVLALLAVPLTIGIWTIALRFVGNETALTDFSSPFSIFTPILTPSFQQTFNVSPVWPWEGIRLGIQAVYALWGQPLSITVTLDMIMVLIFTIAIPFTWKLPRKSYFIYSVGLYIMNLMMVAEAFPLADFPRRMMQTVPVFITFGLFMRHRRGNNLIIISGVLSSAFISAFLLWWLWIG